MACPFNNRTGDSVPFVDLGRVHEPLREQILRAVAAVADSGNFVLGPEVDRFERAFAEYCGAKRGVGVASGLDALRLALLAARPEPGDEAIVPANTFVATFEAITQAGCRPVVVDVTEADYNLAVDAAEAAITERTRFVVPVHLYGQMVDVEALCGLAKRHRVVIVEDACQAHGARRAGHSAGTIGIAGAFSFYPAKNLGAWGDAGAVITNDDDFADRVRALRHHGQQVQRRHEIQGYTARLDTIQAAVLLQKLPFLDEWNARRAATAGYYSAALDGVGDVRLPPVPNGSEPVWHVYPIRTSSAERLERFLAKQGIGSGRHYPEPPHLSSAYASLGYRQGSFPVTEALADELVSLPIFPGITEAELERVVRTVRVFFDRA
jgi:dTDP-4-amino-4,6-dideoxygalactose transaminase